MFLIFGGERFYASGGGNDLLDIDKSLDSAKTKAESLIGKIAVEGDGFMESFKIEWSQVVDGNTGLILSEFNSAYGRKPKILEIKDA